MLKQWVDPNAQPADDWPSVQEFMSSQFGALPLDEEPEPPPSTAAQPLTPPPIR